MRWADVRIGNVLEIQRHKAVVIDITPDGDVTVEIYGRRITRRPDPNGSVNVTGHNDGIAELSGIATRCGGTLDDAQQLIVETYLGGCLLGEQNPDGTYRCKPFSDMTPREREAHMIFFHHDEDGHADADGWRHGHL